MMPSEITAAKIEELEVIAKYILSAEGTVGGLLTLISERLNKAKGIDANTNND